MSVPFELGFSMQRSIGMAVLVASLGLVTAGLWHFGLVSDLPGRGRGRGEAFAPDLASFLAGFAVACLLGWFRRLPWADLLAVLGALARAWRRNATMALFAVACAGILLFY